MSIIVNRIVEDHDLPNEIGEMILTFYSIMKHRHIYNNVMDQLRKATLHVKYFGSQNSINIAYSKIMMFRELRKRYTIVYGNYDSITTVLHKQRQNDNILYELPAGFDRLSAFKLDNPDSLLRSMCHIHDPDLLMKQKYSDKEYFYKHLLEETRREMSLKFMMVNGRWKRIS
jgi:hypothetical protein